MKGEHPRKGTRRIDVDDIHVRGVRGVRFTNIDWQGGSLARNRKFEWIACTNRGVLSSPACTDNQG
jgi:hypothetical protein